jgi:hypothetical protein
MNKNIYQFFKRSVLVFLIAFSLLGNAKENSTSLSPTLTNDLTFSLGNLCEYIGKIQTDDKGSTNACSFLPTFATALDMKMTNDWILSPQIGATLPKSGRDENINRMTLFTLINLKYRTSYINLIAGTGLYFTRISGNGGEEVLNNGNSTESFPLPKEAIWSRNLIVNLGAGLEFNRMWSGEVYTYIFNIEDSKERAISLGLTLSYHFGEVL